MHIRTIKAVLFTLALTFFSVSPFISFADLQIANGDINIEMIPEVPVPYEEVTITVSSYAADLNRASIEWVQDGKTVLGGIGKTSYSLIAPPPNNNIGITIKITPNGSAKTITKNISVRPSEVDMLWEATTSYTPPFYKGKALPTSESFIKITAMPNTSGITNANKKNMVYTWKRNDKSSVGASGYGKGVYSFQNDSLNASEKIKVSVSAPDGSYGTEGQIEIPIQNPNLLFYRKSPLEGIIYENALFKEASMQDDEMTVVAEPYFLSLKGMSDFEYRWKINGKSITTPKDPYALTVRPSSRGGYATIELEMESMSKLFQQVSAAVKINL